MRLKRYIYKCKHKGCNVEQVILNRGLCNYHRHLQRQKENIVPKYNKRIKPISDKRKVQRKKERKCLTTFFSYHLQQLEKHPISIESGEKIYNPTIANIAHLLPKRKQGGFPSVKCTLGNAIYLTIVEHNLFDKLLDERNFKKLEEEFKNSWSFICAEYKKLLNLCTERNKIYFALMKYLKTQ